MVTNSLIPAILAVLLPCVNAGSWAAATQSGPANTHPKQASASQSTAKKKTPSTGAQSPTADGLQEAETLLRNQEYAAAEEKLKPVAAAFPKHPQVWFDLGFAQSHQGKSQDAIASYRKAVEFAPRWFEAHLNLGVTLGKSGNSSEAVPVLRQATELTPLSGGDQARGAAWLALAEVTEQTGNDPKAAALAYDKAADFKAGGPELQVKAGMQLQKSSDAAGAEAHFQKAAEAGDAAGMVQLVKLLGSQQRYADAETWLGKYVAQNPQDSNARLEYSRLLASENKKAEAIAALQAGKQPYPPDVARELAELYLANKQFKDAEALLRPLLEAAPAAGSSQKDPQIYCDLGLALLFQLKYADAEALLLRCVQLKPDLAEAYVHLADAARENQHYDFSNKALDEYVRRAGETPRTYFIRATNYDHLKMYRAAADNYKRFLEVAGGKYPDQEFQARHRLKAIEH